jgi:hypothetical protein
MLQQMLDETNDEGLDDIKIETTIDFYGWKISWA